MRSPRFRPSALSLAVLSMAACAIEPAQAQTRSDTPQVEVIGVSPVPGLGVPRDRVPANVQSATAQDLERSQALDLSSYLATRLGSVHVNEMQGNPLQADISYRGFTASPLLGSAQGLSLYLDGVRLNQPFGDVVSWDLIPRNAIASLVLNPGANPLFGLNTLGGALSVQTKDGRKFHDTVVEASAGAHGRVALGVETGGQREDGLHWYAAAQHFREDGWRVDSASEATQLFAKVGQRVGATDLALGLSLARSDLNGNGLQEDRQLARDWHSVYTRPDHTKNDAVLLNLTFSHALSDSLGVSGNVYHRRLRTRTHNGDLNEGSLDQSVYQPSAADMAALSAAGYTGFPTSGASAANTAFPFWRCIAQALRTDEPGEKCNGVLNTTHTDQRQSGLNLQLNHDGDLFGLKAQSLLGLALDASHSHYVQGSELGYLNADRTITGVGAYGDGVSGGNIDGEPYDTRVDLTGRTRTWSVFGSTQLALSPGVHLTLSGRYNRTTVSNRDAITPGGGTGSLDTDQTFARLNPALGLTFAVIPGVAGYVGLSQGSRAPSAVELGCADPASPCKLPNAFAGDPPLKQVVTTSVEAGLRGGTPGALTWSAGVFRADNRDDLLFVADNAAGFGYFKNFGQTRRQGVELGLDWVPVKGVTLGGQYTYLDATYRSAETVNGAGNSSNSAALAGFPGVDGTIDIRPGDRLPLVPRHLLKLSAQFQPSARWSVASDVVAVGSSLARGNENGQHQADGVYYLGSGRNPGYAVVNLRGEFKPRVGLKFFAQIGNLLDRRYTTAAQLGATGFDANGQFVARPFPANANGDRPLVHTTFYAPGAPRSLSAGVKLTF